MDGLVDGVVADVAQDTKQISQTPRSEISHVGTKESIPFLLTRDWIYKNTFTWEAAQGPGTILAYYPIHPSSCNWFNQHIMAAFNAWTGTMRMRLRMMATAFYGGSIRIGFLPPNISPDRFASLTPEMMTTYPNMDLDPKNTDWVTFESTDQRNVLFHYGDQPVLTEPSTFGGYITIFVVGRLVTQDPEFDRISGVVEMAGNFEFLQPNPVFNVTDVLVDNPLAGSTENILASGGCESTTTNSYASLQILPSSVLNVTTGFWCMRGANRLFGSDYPGCTLPTTIGDTVNQLRAMNLKVVSGGWATSDKTGSNVTWTPYQVSSTANETFLFSVENEAAVVWDPHATSMVNPFRPGFAKWTDITGSGQFVYGPGDAIELSSGDNNALVAYDGYGDAGVDRYRAINLARLGVDPTFVGSQLNNVRADESSVAFVNTQLRTFDMQTRSIGDSLFNSIAVPGLTWVFELSVEDVASGVVTPLMTLRLWPAGYFTARAAAATVLLDSTGKNYHLKFLQLLSDTSPLPIPPPTQLRAMHNIKRHRPAHMDW